VKVTTHGGADRIEAGDWLTSSEIPGVAQKATTSGMMIGRALAGFGGPGHATSTEDKTYKSYTSDMADMPVAEEGTVMVFMETGFADPAEAPPAWESLLSVVYASSTREVVVEEEGAATTTIAVVETARVPVLTVATDAGIQGNLAVEGKAMVRQELRVEGASAFGGAAEFAAAARFLGPEGLPLVEIGASTSTAVLLAHGDVEVEGTVAARRVVIGMDLSDRTSTTYTTYTANMATTTLEGGSENATTTPEALVVMGRSLFDGQVGVMGVLQLSENIVQEATSTDALEGNATSTLKVVAATSTPATVSLRVMRSVGGDARLVIGGNTAIEGTLLVRGAAAIEGLLIVQDAQVEGTLVVKGDVEVGGNVRVAGSSVVGGDLELSGALVSTFWEWIPSDAESRGISALNNAEVSGVDMALLAGIGGATSTTDWIPGTEGSATSSRFALRVGDAVRIAGENAVVKAAASDQPFMPAIGLVVEIEDFSMDEGRLGRNVKVATAGTIKGWEGLTVGERYFLANTTTEEALFAAWEAVPDRPTTTRPLLTLATSTPQIGGQAVQVMGIARSARELMLMPSLEWREVESEKLQITNDKLQTNTNDQNSQPETGTVSPVPEPDMSNSTGTSDTIDAQEETEPEPAAPDASPAPTSSEAPAEDMPDTEDKTNTTDPGSTAAEAADYGASTADTSYTTYESGEADTADTADAPASAPADTPTP
jgi:hypothetical protein